MSKTIPLQELLDPETLKKHEPALLKYLEEGGTWQEILGYDAEVMEDYYATAQTSYEEREYAVAIGGFQYLTLLNPYEYRHWFGLGCAQHAAGKFEEAIAAYTAAGAIELNNPFPELHIAQCLAALDLLSDAIARVEEVLPLARRESPTALQEAEKLLAFLRSKQ